MTTTPRALHRNDLRKISGLPTNLSLQMAAAFLADLVEDPDFMDSEVLPFLKESEGAGSWYVARRYDGEDGSLKVFVWPPGTGTRIHDHSSWGVYHCVMGSVLEERYKRLDDGSIPEHARLRKIWQLMWSPEDGCSTVLPGDGGIHRVTNVGEEVAVSVHLYGPRLGKIDGRDYDPSQNYVCDRSED